MAFEVFGNLQQLVLDKAQEALDSVGGLMEYIAPIAAAAFSLYVVLVIWSYANRGLEEPIHDFTRRMLGWMVVIALAFNGGNYSRLSTMVLETPNEVSRMLTTEAITGDNLDHKVNKVVDTCQTVLKNVSDKVKIDEPVWFITWVVLSFLSFILVLMYGAFLCALFSAYIAAKLILYFLLIMGPAALAGMLFPATRQYGMNWISSCLSGIFQLVLITVVFALVAGLLDGKLSPINFIQNIGTDTASGTDCIIQFCQGMLRVAIAFVLYHFVMVQIPSLTSGVFGGAHFSGAGFAASLSRSTDEAIRTAGMSVGAARGAAAGVIRGGAGTYKVGKWGYGKWKAKYGKKPEKKAPAENNASAGNNASSPESSSAAQSGE